MLPTAFSRYVHTYGSSFTSYKFKVPQKYKWMSHTKGSQTPKGAILLHKDNIRDFQRWTPTHKVEGYGRVGCSHWIHNTHKHFVGMLTGMEASQVESYLLAHHKVTPTQPQSLVHKTSLQYMNTCTQPSHMRIAFPTIHPAPLNDTYLYTTPPHKLLPSVYEHAHIIPPPSPSPQY